MNFLLQVLTLAAIVAGTALTIWLGIHFGERWINRMLALPVIDASKGISVTLQKRPVAFRVKDHADGWILCHTEEVANNEAEEHGGSLVQGLYVRDGS